MHTLALRNRDLVLAPGAGFATVTGAQRLQQDLTLALGEDYGNDRFHPGWGSVLFQMVGSPIDPALRHEVEAEASRVINNYQLTQQDYIQQDIINAVNSRFTTADLLAEVISVKSQLAYDSINLVIEIKNLDNSTVLVAAGAN